MTEPLHIMWYDVVMQNLKQQAIILRKAGNSYAMIHSKIAIPKSTLSNWLSRIPFYPNEELSKRIGRAKVKSAMYRHRLKMEDIEERRREAAREVGILSDRDIFMLGIGIYIGEGSKAIEEVRIVNSNPAVIRIGACWLRKFCLIRDEHIRMTIHAYPDTDIPKSLRFWSKQTKIPLTQFGKTIIDNRSKKSDRKYKRLPYGTANLYVRGNGTLERGVKSLHRKIIGWIEHTEKQF